MADTKSWKDGKEKKKKEKIMRFINKFYFSYIVRKLTNNIEICKLYYVCTIFKQSMMNRNQESFESYNSFYQNSMTTA